MIKPHDVGTKQYIQWLILIDRVHPSFIAGVILGGTSHREGRVRAICRLSYRRRSAKQSVCTPSLPPTNVDSVLLTLNGVSVL